MSKPLLPESIGLLSSFRIQKHLLNLIRLLVWEAMAFAFTVSKWANEYL
jgi:hypothetical protein